MSEVKRYTGLLLDTAPHDAPANDAVYVLASDYDALKRVAETTSEFALRRDAVATALAARCAELEAMLKPHSVPPAGSASMSQCGCHSWTDGIGNHGEYKCYVHREKSSHADEEKHT